MSEGEGEDFLRLVVTNAVSSAVTQLTAEPRLVRTPDGEAGPGC